MLCAWASINEKGKIMGGKMGDQTGREVRTGGYYYFGQTFCIRPRRQSVAEDIAACAHAIALNDKVGYGQDDRESLFKAMRRKGWGSYVIDELCDTDCSELAVCCANYALGCEAFPADLYSGNIVPVMTRNSNFVKITIGKYFEPHTGDIIVAPGKHVIIVVESDYVGHTTEKPHYEPGKTYTLDVNLKVRTGAGVKYAWKKREELTEDGKRHSQDRPEAVLKQGTRVTCKNVIESGDDLWIEIPSGFIAAFYGGETYVIDSNIL